MIEERVGSRKQVWRDALTKNNCLTKQQLPHRIHCATCFPVTSIQSVNRWSYFLNIYSAWSTILLGFLWFLVPQCGPVATPPYMSFCLPWLVFFLLRQTIYLDSFPNFLTHKQTFVSLFFFLCYFSLERVLFFKSSNQPTSCRRTVSDEIRKTENATFYITSFCFDLSR